MRGGLCHVPRRVHSVSRGHLLRFCWRRQVQRVPQRKQHPVHRKRERESVHRVCQGLRVDGKARLRFAKSFVVTLLFLTNIVKAIYYEYGVCVFST